MLTHLKDRFYLALALLISVFLIGVFGFYFIADYTWLNAVYMTIITVSTVGYGEPQPLEGGAKIFAIGLILASLAIIGFSISVITEYILARSNPKLILNKKMNKSIASLENHVIICGYGRNGKEVAQKMKAHNKSFIVIENIKEIVDRYKAPDIPMLHGNAIDDEVLKEAKIYKAKYLVTALPEDADNLFIVLSARQMNKDLKIISRASKPSSYKKLRLAGADNVIMPDKIGGDHMASLVVVPDLVEFLDNLSLVGKGAVNIEELPSEKLTLGKANQSILDLNVRALTGCTIIGYKDPEGKYTVNPPADQLLEFSSRVIVLGSAEQIKKLNELYHISASFD